MLTAEKMHLVLTAEDGRSLVRPMYHDHPHADAAYDVPNEYAFGDDLVPGTPLPQPEGVFPRHEEVELSWKILDPITEFWAENLDPAPYRPGSWGPDTAHDMLARDGRTWRRP